MNNFLKTLFAVITLSFLFTNCNTENTDSSSKGNQFHDELDSVLTTLYQNGEFNGNVLVAKNDEIIYNKGFGFSNGDRKTILSKTDKFNIGSIYKEIPAIAIMQLEEKELLKLDDPISKYLSHLPNWSNQITILNLLQYTGGLPKINWGKHPEINDEVLMKDLLEIPDLEFTPGEGYLYTNYSPFLLSKIVESVSSKSFSEYATQNILKPLELNQSHFNESFPYKNRSAMAISFNNEFIEDKPPFTIKSSIFLFSTTTKDLFKLLKGLHSYNLIEKNSVKALGETAELDIKNMESALGQIKYQGNQIIEHTHHGSTGNYECLINKDISNNNTIIILTNSKKSNVYSIKNAIEDLM
ncbi:Beta-lactamase [Marivirga sericea]|uniref:Beta-lactamase n=1 Tax=Marivirga sericea TaxID=1028 RepID=A0A1X7K5G0_9BACT|nr:serine hydrolase domain-containing protein [Marivirga sericea]SMG35861.1 Beta-lactamase [Marivirga sericea]